jgi:hypothetical protein
MNKHTVFDDHRVRSSHVSYFPLSRSFAITYRASGGAATVRRLIADAPHSRVKHEKY